MTLVCLLFTACNKDDILPGGPMLWTYEILTPESVEYEGGTVGWIPKECFKANGNEGYIVMTCENFDMLNPISGGSYTYDCGWATLEDSFSPSGFGSPGCIRGDYNLDK